jgi:hypothetical protein
MILAAGAQVSAQVPTNPEWTIPAASGKPDPAAAAAAVDAAPLHPMGMPKFGGKVEGPSSFTQGDPKSFALQGTVTRQALPTASLTATIEREIKRPSPGPPSKFIALTLHLKNPGDDTLILDGDNATAYYSSGSQARNASELQTVKDASNMLTKKQKYLVALVTLGTATLGGPLFYEWIMGGESNPKLSMGEDEIRRRVEGVRLGERVMLAEENADGTVFLPAEQGMPTSIVIPVLTYPGRVPAGALRVDIPATASR